MDKYIEKYLKFMKAATHACVEIREKVFAFKCPICGKEAHASRSTYNGHMHASCDSCGLRLME